MRVHVLAASVLVTVAGATVGLAGPASAGAKDDGLTLLVPTLASMLPGQQGWISTIWQASQDVCDMQVTLTGPGAKVTYPESTADFSSFYTASALAAGNTDYTAFRVTAPATATGPVTMTLNVDYRLLPPGQIKKDDDLKTKKVNCSGPKASQTVNVTLPVTPSTGAAITVKTPPVLVKKGTPTWTKIVLRGNKPGLDNLKVTLTPPPGLEVVYPGDASAAGLNNGPTLAVAEDDFFSVRLTATGLDPEQTYRVPLTATYTGGSFTGSVLIGAA
ncbi:hypothetical protein [Krasilnikovia sp. MM14-A1004]|uniref:hypothetical protein n=1 Tax=Krasilnikovia sp. MM14-A1004 TaxID=3373541 RepID=UPI00399D3DDD